MAEAIERRDYQIALKEQTYAAWNAGHKNVLNVLSTGGGKSIIMSDIVADCSQLKMNVPVIAHRNELVSQMSMHVARRGIPHNIIGSDETIAQIRRAHRSMFHGEQLVNPSSKVSVVGVDTLMARSKDLGKWAYQQDRWLGDEFHHCIIDNKWGKAVAMMPNALGVGFTATPLRADGQGLGIKELGGDGVFHHMNVGPGMRELIERNFLCDFEIVCPRSDLKVSEDELSAGGDWSNQTLRKAAKRSHIVGDAVDNYAKYAWGRRAILFATDVETANETAQKFNQAGIPAASLNAKTPVLVREKYISEFRSGKIWVLINVDLFDEGFDVPACDVVIMARPTASLGKYLQMVGRALRYIWGKIALIIDMVSNVVRHGLPDKYRIWSLARREKRAKHRKDPEELPLIECKQCTKPYEIFRRCCPYCGFVKPLPEPRQRTLEMVEGDLILLDRAALEQMRLATVLDNPADVQKWVAEKSGGYAGMAAYNKQIEKAAAHAELKDTLAQWAGIQRAKGLSDSEIHSKLYHTIGVDMLTILSASNTPSEMQSLIKTIQGWWRK
jgi:superfamily II DNA or RNA helicase